MGKKYPITLGGDASGILDAWARAEGLPPGTVAARLLTSSLLDARNRGLFPMPEIKSNQVLGQGLRQMTTRWISDPELIELAHDSSVPVEVLKTIRDCLHKNGGKTSVHQR